MDDIQFPAIIAHRGASAYATENSLLALEMTAEFEATWVEYDVQLTADNRLVVVHDENLKRLTGHNVWVKELTLAEIQALPLQHSMQQEKTQYIPSLEQWLDLAAQLGIKHNLELKCEEAEVSALVNAVVSCVRAYQLNPEHIVFSSFCLPAMQMLRVALPEYWMGWLLASWNDEWQQQAETFAANAIHLNANDVTAERVEAIHAAGYKCLAYTVNRKKRAAKLLALGVDALFSNYPDLLA